MRLILTQLMLTFIVFASLLSAEIDRNEGAVAHCNLPPPGKNQTYVRLDVPHLRQGHEAQQTVRVERVTVNERI